MKIFGELIGILLEAYMSLMISGYMAVKANLWGEAAEILGNIFAYIVLTIGILILPVLSFSVTLMKKNQLKTKLIRRACGELFEGVKTTHWSTRINNFLMIFKRIIFLFVAFCTDDPIY